MAQLIITEPKNIESLVASWTPAYPKPVSRRVLHPGTRKWVMKAFWFPEPEPPGHSDIARVTKALEKLKPYSQDFQYDESHHNGQPGYTGVAEAWEFDEDQLLETCPVYRLSPEALRRDYGEFDRRLAPWLAPSGLRGLGAYVSLP